MDLNWLQEQIIAIFREIAVKNREEIAKNEWNPYIIN